MSILTLSNISPFEKLAELLSYGFVRNAVIVSVLIALCAALLGVILVLRHYSALGDGLSHIAFGGVALGVALGASDLTISLPITAAAAILILGRRGERKIMGDAAIAMMSVGSLALGYTVLSIRGGSGNLGGDVCTALFGSSEILSTSNGEIILALSLAVLLGALAAVFYYRIFSVTFDERAARATGERVDLYNVLFAVLTAVVIVVGMKLAGALLISSLVVFPAMSAMRICRSFKGVLIASAIISSACALIGALLSIVIETPVGATIAAVDIFAFALFSVVGKITKR